MRDRARPRPLLAAEAPRVRDERDERIGALFRRWPQLTSEELRELSELWDRRIELARRAGLRRRPAS